MDDYDWNGEGHNHCRNPDGDSGGVWCITNHPDIPWEYCPVPICWATLYNECQEGGFAPGKDFSGRTNVTASGLTCQHWAASEPHVPKYTDVGKVGDTEAGEHNHCRNPSESPRGVWCYTTDPDVRLERCSVPICGPTMLKVLDFSADND